MEQIFAVLVDRSGGTGLVLFKAFFENLVGRFAHKLFNLPQLLLLLLYQPFLFIHKTWLEPLIVLVARSRLGLFYALLTLVVLPLFEGLSIHSIVVLLGPDVLPLFHFFNSLYLGFRFRSDTKEVTLLALCLRLI